MRKLFFVLALIATCAFNGFAQKTVVKKFQDTQARMLDINATGYVKPLAVELKVLEVGRINQSWPLTKEQAEVLWTPTRVMVCKSQNEMVEVI